jgi:hypothetical protein
MLGKLIANDIFKQKRTMMLLVIIAIPLFTSLLLLIDFNIRYKSYLYPIAIQKGMTSWQSLLHEQRIVFFKEYLPMFGAMILAALFDNEYKNNAWTLELTLPISRGKLILSKFITSLIFMSIMLIVNAVSLIAVGKIMGFPEPINLMDFIKMFLLQFVFVTSSMAIHLYLTIKNKNTLVSIGIAGFACMISSNSFYDGDNISKFNPYSFASFSDGLTKVNMPLMLGISIILIIAVLFYTVKYFNNKECY